MKPLLKFLKVSFRSGVYNEMVYRSNFYMSIFRIFLNAIMLFALWTALYAGKTQIDGINLSTMVFYAFASIVFEILISSNIENTITVDIRSGNIALKMARPIKYPKTLFINQIAFTGVNFVLRILPYSIVLFIVYITMNPDMKITLLFVVSALLSYILFILYQLVFGLISFWTMEISGIVEARNAAMLVFSGSLIPLWFFPEWLFDIAKFLPFQAMFHTPLSILIQKIQGSDIWSVLLVQFIWITFFALISVFLWSKAKRKVVVNGG